MVRFLLQSVAVSFLTPHMKLDVFLWIFFVLGQLLYVLKRAGMSMRSGRIKKRRDYVFSNWDVLVIRMACELPIYWFIRHISIGAMASIIGWNLPSWVPADVLNSPVAIFFVGLGADVLLDWISVSSKLPDALKKFIKETVPPVPLNGGI